MMFFFVFRNVLLAMCFDDGASIQRLARDWLWLLCFDLAVIGVVIG